MALITIRDDGTWDYGTPGEADHFLGDHDSCHVVLLSRFEEVAQELERRADKLSISTDHAASSQERALRLSISLIRQAGKDEAS